MASDLKTFVNFADAQSYARLQASERGIATQLKINDSRGWTVSFHCPDSAEREAEIIQRYLEKNPPIYYDERDARYNDPSHPFYDRPDCDRCLGRGCYKCGGLGVDLSCWVKR